MIKQRVHAVMNFIGDGTSTTYSFDLGRIYGMNFRNENNTTGDAFSLIHSDALPDSVSVDFAGGVSGFFAATATLSRRTITLEFSSAFDVEVTVGLSLEFNG